MDNKPRYQSILRNPQTDIFYKNSRPDIPKKLAEKTGIDKEKLFPLLGYKEAEWLKKLGSGREFSTKEMLEIAEKGRMPFMAGRNTGKYEAYMPVTKDDFCKTAFEMLSKTSDDIDKSSLDKNKKGLIARCCGTGIMNSVKDEESIKAICRPEASFETLNQCLYALSICLDYAPPEPCAKEEKARQLAANTVKELGLRRYEETPKTRKVKEAIKDFLATQDSDVLQATIGLSLPIPDDPGQLPIGEFTKLMSICGYRSLKEDETTSSKTRQEAQESLLGQICATIGKIPFNARKLIAEETGIQEELLDMQPEPGSTPAEYIIKLGAVIGSPIEFLKDEPEADRLQYEEEKAILLDAGHAGEASPVGKPPQAEAKAKPRKAPQKTSKPAKAEPEKPGQEASENLESKNRQAPSTNPPAAGKEAAKEQKLLSILLPIARKYYDLELGETFKIDSTELVITEEDGIEKITNTDGEPLCATENADTLATFLEGEIWHFQRGKFMPKDGQEYWTIGIPDSMKTISRIYGENKLADLLSEKLGIIYKNQAEAEKADPGKIIRKLGEG